MRQRSPHGFNRAGFVKIGEETYPCQLTNLSVTGATIIFDGPIDLPERFAVQLTADGHVTRACKTTWQEGIETGVVFE
ncbi:PilZ domain-containing protein [Rhodoplanes sp. Z2-YC6860]|uniref:PilZ domain-containing protein n=1 Tax=Rhodoplanes sp. Z2-YC6860 TaxID=674703 RepID=UPI0018DC47DD|nr:PilZ domain-containing protein [Rhodoplanes sp. Z2-YC6860]